jgi:PhoH-like ATPase
VKSATRRLFVLDTNVLMHDPTAIFRFEEHDIYLPMVVLEELDANKKGLSEASRNARQVSRFLDDMMRGVTKEQIDAGLPIRRGPTAAITARSRPPAGCSSRPASCQAACRRCPGSGADNLILGQTLSLQRQQQPTGAGRAGTASGASPRATASRTSRSTC